MLQNAYFSQRTTDRVLAKVTTWKILKNAVPSEKYVSLLDSSERRRRRIKRKSESTDASVYADAKEDCAHERER